MFMEESMSVSRFEMNLTTKGSRRRDRKVLENGQVQKGNMLWTMSIPV